MKFLFLIFFFMWVNVVNAEPQLKQRPLPPKFDKCHLRHAPKTKRFISPVKRPQKEHGDIDVKHGNLEISCHSCHDINHSNYLRSRGEEKASFQNSSPICKQCHIEQYRNWKKGIHGKRSGSWEPSLQIQYHCIDCHNPHDVTFKKMKAFPPPQRPGKE